MPPESGIVARGLSALRWGVLGSILRVSMQIASQVVLARLLGPEQFGLFATALIAVTLVNFFADFGIAYSLIQKKEVSPQDIRFVTTWQLILGVSVAVALYCAAPLFAGFFHNEKLEPVIASLSVVCLINALAATSTNLLKRELNFGQIQLASTASYAVGYLAVGIILANLNAGVWALIAAFFTTAILNLLLLYRATKHPIRPLFWTVGAKGILGYGFTVLFTNIINWAVSSIDRAIVGRYFSTAAVGYYTTACNFVYSPGTTLLGVLQPVLFSSSAKVQDNVANLRTALLGALAATSLCVAPVFIGIAAVAPTLVQVLYGHEWQGMGELLRPFALAMPLMIILGMATPTLWISGKTRLEFILQFPIALLVALACYVAAQYSTLAVAWTVLCLFVVRSLIIVGAAARMLELDKGQILRALGGGLFVCSLLGGLLPLLDMAFWKFSFPAQLILLLDIVAAVVLLGGAILARPGLIHHTLRQLLQRVKPPRNKMASSLLRRLSSTRDQS